MDTQRVLDVAFGCAVIGLGLALLVYFVAPEPQLAAVAVWALVSVFGGLVATKGWVRRSSFGKFAGASLLAAGIHCALWAAEVMDPMVEEIIASALIWIGLGFSFVWLSSPYKLDLLVPTALFLGPGIGYYLWWYDYVGAVTLRTWATDGWPILLVFLGAGILLRALRPAR